MVTLSYDTIPDGADDPEAEEVPESDIETEEAVLSVDPEKVCRRRPLVAKAAA